MGHAARGAAVVVRAERASVLASTLSLFASAASDAQFPARVRVRGEPHRGPDENKDQGGQRKKCCGALAGAETAGSHLIDNRPGAERGQVLAWSSDDGELRPVASRRSLSGSTSVQLFNPVLSRSRWMVTSSSSILSISIRPESRAHVSRETSNRRIRSNESSVAQSELSS